MTPNAIIALGHDDIRKQGLSSAKSQTILDLAERSIDGRLALDRLTDMSDADILTIPRGTVASRLRRARSDFRERVRALDPVSKVEGNT